MELIGTALMRDISMLMDNHYQHFFFLDRVPVYLLSHNEHYPTLLFYPQWQP